MRFRPLAPLDEPALTALPCVTKVARDGTQVDVAGTGDFASAVTGSWPAGRSSWPTSGSKDAAWTTPMSPDRPHHGHVRERVTMNGFSKIAHVETKLFLREKAATGLFGLPVSLVIGFGLIPGFGQPQKGLSGQIGTEYIAALGVAIVLATLGLNGVPMVIGHSLERGICCGSASRRSAR